MMMMMRFLLLIFYLLLITLAIAKSHNNNDDDDDNKTNNYTERFMKNFDIIYLFGQQFTTKFLKPLYDETITDEHDLNLTKECHHSLEMMFTHPELEWASLSKLIIKFINV